MKTPLGINCFPVRLSDGTIYAHGDRKNLERRGSRGQRSVFADSGMSVSDSPFGSVVTAKRRRRTVEVSTEISLVEYKMCILATWDVYYDGDPPIDTLRYPGFGEYWYDFTASGYFAERPTAGNKTYYANGRVTGFPIIIGGCLLENTSYDVTLPNANMPPAVFEGLVVNAASGLPADVHVSDRFENTLTLAQAATSTVTTTLTFTEPEDYVEFKSFSYIPTAPPYGILRFRHEELKSIRFAVFNISEPARPGVVCGPVYVKLDREIWRRDRIADNFPNPAYLEPANNIETVTYGPFTSLADADYTDSTTWDEYTFFEDYSPIIVGGTYVNDENWVQEFYKTFNVRVVSV